MELMDEEEFSKAFMLLRPFCDFISLRGLPFRPGLTVTLGIV